MGDIHGLFWWNSSERLLTGCHSQVATPISPFCVASLVSLRTEGTVSQTCLYVSSGCMQSLLTAVTDNHVLVLSTGTCHVLVPLRRGSAAAIRTFSHRHMALVIAHS